MNVHRLRDINAALVLFSAMLALSLLYQVFRTIDPPEEGNAGPPEELIEFPTLVSSDSGELDGLSYDSIVEKNLFSSDRTPPEGRTKTVSRDDEGGTVSFEGFELTGTVLSDEDRSFALVRKGGMRGETKSYRLGDDVGGMELREILYDRIILSKNGRDIILLLQPREAEKKANTPVNSKKIERRTPKPGVQSSGQQSWTSKKRKGQ